jgi:hypothetical protein
MHMSWQRYTAVALAAAALSTPFATQAARVDIDIDVAPPPPRYEVVPAPRAGYVWAPGYWSWEESHHHHVWHGGYWVREHRGERWVPHQWIARDGRYHFNEGHWEGGG